VNRQDAEDSKDQSSEAYGRSLIREQDEFRRHCDGCKYLGGCSHAVADPKGEENVARESPSSDDRHPDSDREKESNRAPRTTEPTVVRDTPGRSEEVSREVLRLRAQVVQAEQELESSRKRLEELERRSNSDPRKFDLEPDDWRALGRSGTLMLRIPCGGSSATPRADQLDALGLAPSDGPVIAAAFQEFAERVWAVGLRSGGGLDPAQTSATTLAVLEVSAKHNARAANSSGCGPASGAWPRERVDGQRELISRRWRRGKPAVRG
jgi:hypothetical protein